MPTFVYAPGVKVYIEREVSKGKFKVVDVSDDVTEGTLIRRSDGVSTFNFSLQNANRKYDQVFAPNDRLVVMMKRITWLKVFTGYLNSVPLISAWPTVVNLSASCSLKRLQYWYWDPYAPYTQEMIRNSLAAGAGTNGDGGVTNVVLSILEKVTRWPASKVHIGKIPEAWLDFALEIAEEVNEELKKADVDLPTPLGDGSGTTLPLGDVGPGAYGPMTFSTKQVQSAGQIYIEFVSQNKGFTEDDIAFAIYCAICETNINTNYNGSGFPGYGLYSQEESQAGWSASFKKKMEDERFSTRQFIERYQKLVPDFANRNVKRDHLRLSKQVQRYGKVGRYDDADTWPAALALAKAIGDAARSTSTTPRTGATPTSSVRAAERAAETAATAARTGAVTSSEIYRWARQILIVDAARPIMYEQVTGSARKAQYTSDEPTKLDCSLLVAWVYKRATGKNDLYTNAIGQRGKARQIDLQLGYDTPGALLYTNDPSNHVGISTGDGDGTAIQASRKHSDVRKDIAPSGGNRWQYAGLLPGVDYGGTLGSGPTGDSAVPDGTTSASQGTPYELDGANPFNQLFGTIWYPEQEAGAQFQAAAALTGIRSLMNDSPLLPYIRDLMQSTMRSMCSAPNGDFIAWFPDYYGIWGNATKYTIEPIEVMDFNVTWTDDFFVTHQFALAGQYNKLDVDSGNVQTPNYSTGGADIRTQTVGVATIEVPSLMKALFNIDADEQFSERILQRFGARPDYQAADGIIGRTGEFFLALYLFMRQWVYQYNADIPTTFMPEVWPGMIIQMPDFDFQAYVVTVTHSFKFGQGGGFQTLINIAAPARMPGKKGSVDHALIGLPDFGGIRGPRSHSVDIGQDVNFYGEPPPASLPPAAPKLPYSGPRGQRSPDV